MAMNTQAFGKTKRCLKKQQRTPSIMQMKTAKVPLPTPAIRPEYISLWVLVAGVVVGGEAGSDVGVVGPVGVVAG